jgi:nitrogen fixation NifU-like protein
MTSDIDDLYQRIILEHAKHPRNDRTVVGSVAERQNPLCGDEVAVSLRLSDGRIAEIGATGQGCALSRAAASLMTVAATGLTPTEARALDARFRALLAGGPGDGLGELAAFAGVARFPVRAQCATLPWQALLDALAA